MGEREIIQLVSSSSASDERDEEGGGGGGEEEEGEEDCMLSTNNTNKDENKEEDKREKSIRGGVGRGPSYSNCSFPMSRIKRLMKNEGVLHFRTTPEFVFLINKATEQFLELFAEDAYACAVRERKKSLNYEHLSSVVTKEKRYEFLSDFVPEKVRAKDALSVKSLNES
ncbi:DNA polymerase epsilon subunit C [Cinnamomum micranthum f. kanehirae]|uniref:DNA polymerase epsilon subunit C n=1 Tax=Cinnamomum micranthum f. kanehirae TaxID=337451 RepID=A0A443NPB0_9MAGN|nr:DNA polymerase epsilon subunit C [Cinnamomum micranthum f. kanehirae]